MPDPPTPAERVLPAPTLRALSMLMAAVLASSTAFAQELPARAALKLGARVQIDHSSFRGVNTHTGHTAAATWLRRADASARLRLSPRWSLSAGVTHDEGKLVVDTAALTWQPVSNLRLHAGRIDADFGLDSAASSSWTAAIERSAIWDLAPGIGDVGQGHGLRADGHGHGWHASTGLYDRSVGDAFIIRAVWISRPAPLRVVQIGASAARGQGIDSNGRLRTRLGMRGVTEANAGRRSELAPAVAAPARYESERALAVEAAVQRGAWLLQGEALHRRLMPGASAPGRSVSGQSLQLAWSPSGQPRRHDEQMARFGRPAGDGLAHGRWELFYRFDRLQGVEGSGAEVHTWGASWFLDRHWRVSVNAVSNRSDDPNRAGDRVGSGGVVRVQAVF